MPWSADEVINGRAKGQFGTRTLKALARAEYSISPPARLGNIDRIIAITLKRLLPSKEATSFPIGL